MTDASATPDPDSYSGPWRVEYLDGDRLLDQTLLGNYDEDYVLWWAHGRYRAVCQVVERDVTVRITRLADGSVMADEQVMAAFAERFMVETPVPAWLVEQVAGDLAKEVAPRCGEVVGGVTGIGVVTCNLEPGHDGAHEAYVEWSE